MLMEIDARRRYLLCSVSHSYEIEARNGIQGCVIPASEILIRVLYLPV